jgi:hypothetical protein
MRDRNKNHFALVSKYVVNGPVATGCSIYSNFVNQSVTKWILCYCLAKCSLKMSQKVVSEGIFHGLPTFPQHNGKKLSIIVTGANGISGSVMMKVLLEALER